MTNAMSMDEKGSFEKLRKMKIAEREKEKVAKNTTKDVLVIEKDYLN